MGAVREVRAADLFCGGGGSSTGMDRACRRLGRRLRLTAINHDETAVSTHAANHPSAVHLVSEVDKVNPRDAVPYGELDLLWASPECIYHSIARGGLPINDQRRASAWCILRWVTAIRIRRVIVENVREFVNWGPLNAKDRPIKSRRGDIFHAFVGALEAAGYRCEWKVLNAADYGDATCRKRFFLQAALGRLPIRWPDQTHCKGGGRTLFGEVPPWRGAREIIDWARPGKSIFNRKRPLSPNTIRRIKAGLEKFGGEQARPFLALFNGGGCAGAGGARDVDGPLPTVTAGGNHLGLVSPFLVPANYGEREGQAPRCNSIDAPMPTITCCNSHGVVEPYIVRFNRTGGPDPVSGPLGAITCNDRFGLAVPDGRWLDILFRMLHWRELASAHSFPEDYVFKGPRDKVVWQIGNSVPVRLSEQLTLAALSA